MPLDRNGLLAGTDRGSEPSSWRHTSTKPAIVLTWHHTIPWHCLAAVWNGLVAGEHWDAVKSFLQLVSAHDPAGIVRQIRAGTLMNRDLLHTQLTWQGWNIVEGPGTGFRMDDPKDGFDVWSTIHGVSGSRRATIQSVNLLYTVMGPLGARQGRAGYLGKVPLISAIEARQLDRMMTSQMGNLRGKSPVLWNRDAWETLREGKVARREPGKWDTTPSWRKRA